MIYNDVLRKMFYSSAGFIDPITLKLEIQGKLGRQPGKSTYLPTRLWGQQIRNMTELNAEEEAAKLLSDLNHMDIKIYYGYEPEDIIILLRFIKEKVSTSTREKIITELVLYDL